MRWMTLLLAAGLLMGTVRAEDKPKAPESKAESKPKKPKIYKVGDKVELTGVYKDLAGGTDVDLAKAFKESKKGVIFLWYSPTCPYCFRFVEEKTKLKEKYTKEGWTFIGVCSNSFNRRMPDAATHKKMYTKQKVPFPVINDIEQKVLARAFGAQRTPTYAVIPKATGKLGYLGSARGLKNKTPYLAPYLDAVGAGKEAPKLTAEMAAWG